MGEKKDLVEQRLDNFDQLRELGVPLYPHRYDQTHTVADLVARYGGMPAEALEKDAVQVQTAGRLINLRGHGKAGFGDLLGAGERIQVYVRQDRVGEENHRLYQLLDIGDFIGVRGHLFRTRTGELTIFAERLDFLAKGLLPLPEKWHGLSDVETRYRQRYLDLIANRSVREIFVQRSRLISAIRECLESKGYLEVETPMMQPLAGGAAARPFKTFHEALGIPLFLRIAPELYLKRLIVGGFERVFEINRSFRNEGISTQHNPEFTMLEFYQAYSDYRDLMDFTEEMFQQVVGKVMGTLELTFAGEVVDFGKFRRYSLVEALRKFWRDGPAPSAEELCDREQLVHLTGKLGIFSEPGAGWGHMQVELFEHVVEEQLIQPTIIHDFPAELSPLAKTRSDDPRFAERFELYAGGLEVANAYSELNDPREQEKRFRQQAEDRARGNEEAHGMDDDYIRALNYGMPPTAGEGIGIDRLAMILTDSPSIREVILFPQLRPESDCA